MGGTNVRLFFVDGARLRSVSRRVPQRDIRVVLDELVKGVSSTDPLGIASAIPKDTKIIDIQGDSDGTRRSKAGARRHLGRHEH